MLARLRLKHVPPLYSHDHLPPLWQEGQGLVAVEGWGERAVTLSLGWLVTALSIIS
jgi:hypothetical protein